MDIVTTEYSAQSGKSETGELALGMPDEFFSTEHLKTDLKGRSVRGGAVTMGAQGARFFLQMGSMVVLARLLTPEDYGLIAMVTVVTGFVAMFKDMGLSMATVQRAEVNHGQISTLFWINVLLSLGLMLVTAALAPAIAWFYGEPQLVWVTLALAGAFIFGGLTVQHQALLRRQMRFGSLGLIQIVSMLVGVITAIIAAFYGAGYWALVFMELVTAITSAIAVWVVCGWRPGKPVRGSGVRPMLAFGGSLTGFSFLNYFTRNADNVIIGYALGSGALGYYCKAYNLLTLPIRQVNGPLSSVAIPALSVLQKQPEEFSQYFRKAVGLVAFLSVPLIVFVIVFAEDIIHLVLGDQWQESVPIFRALGPAALMGAWNVAPGWLFVACNHTTALFRYGLVSAPITILAFLIGVQWGAVGVAYAFSITFWTLYIFIIPYACYQTPVKPADFISSIWRPVLAAICAAIFAVITTRIWSTHISVIQVLVCAAMFAFYYLLAISILPGGSQMLNDVRSLIANLRPHGG